MGLILLTPGYRYFTMFCVSLGSVSLLTIYIYVHTYIYILKYAYVILNIYN